MITISYINFWNQSANDINTDSNILNYLQIKYETNC